MTDQPTGRALAEAAARAMGWTSNKHGGWYLPNGDWRDHEADGGPEPTEREMLAWLHERGKHGALRDALMRLVVAVAEREATNG